MYKILDLFRLDGKVAIVTGGTQGIGYEMVRGLSSVGADVAILDLKFEGAQKAAAEVSAEFGNKVVAFGIDVSDPEKVAETVKAVLDEFGKIDILCNNAGICINKPAEENSYAEWRKVIDVNMNSVWWMSTEVGRYMIKNGVKGTIVNTSSMSAIIVNDPQPQVSYNAAKAGVSHITKSLAAEWAKYGIRVNAIAPGYIDTPLCQAVYDEDGEWAHRWNSMTPMGRPGHAWELAPLVVYLASDASSFMTGSICVIDGGYTIW